MSDLETLSARIDSLEARIAYQDQVIEDLNQTVIAQWKQIDGLRRHMGDLVGRLQEVEDNSGSTPEPPPPHY